MFWGPFHLWGQFLGCPPLLLNQESLPLLPAFSPHSQLTEWRYGIMVIEGYVLGSPPLVGASFGMPTSSVGPRVPPSLLPLTPSHSPHSLSPPLTPTLLCLALLLLSLASNDTMFCGAHHLFLLCFAVPTTSLLFCGGHHLFGAKGPFQLTHFAPSLFPLAPLAPLLLPLAPLAPSCSPCSPRSLSLPMVKLG